MEATTRSALIAFFALALASGAGGCASSSKKQGPGPETQSSGPRIVNPADPYGPPLPPSADNPTTTYGPEPILFKPVVLVLGPGMARGYAYVGAIRALEEAKIPIGAVLGTEMGAFVGALYAMDGKINRLEWAMLKFRDGTFESRGSLLPEVFQKKSRVKKLELGLSGILKGRDLGQSKLPLRIAVEVGGDATVLERGPAFNAVRAAIADPETFEPGVWNGSPAASTAKSRPLLISEAKAMNLGPVVAVVAMESAEERRSVRESELKEADLVIRPDLAGIGAKDFQKKTEAAFRGKSAVKQKISEIRHLVGLPAQSEDSKGSQ